MNAGSKPQTIDQYIANYTPDVQEILQKIRVLIKEVMPEAQEKISYQMPCFALNGNIIYFAAFKKHIGIFPPVEGDPDLNEKLLPYRGPKGNLKFPLDVPMPFALIEEVAKALLKAHQDRLAAKG